LAKMAAGGPNPFVDSGELHRRLAGWKADFETELAKQRAARHPANKR